MIDRGIPRHGYQVFTDGEEHIGEVTTGTQSPTLKKNIGLALIDKRIFRAWIRKSKWKFVENA